MPESRDAATAGGSPDSPRVVTAGLLADIARTLRDDLPVVLDAAAATTLPETETTRWLMAHPHCPTVSA